VNVNDDYFSPTTVHPGMDGNVTWLWAGINPHNVVFADNMGNSILMTGGTHDRNFSTAAPGYYPYRCTIHGGMTGTVVVP
jgi:plastocyanin